MRSLNVNGLVDMCTKEQHRSCIYIWAARNGDFKAVVSRFLLLLDDRNQECLAYRVPWWYATTQYCDICKAYIADGAGILTYHAGDFARQDRSPDYIAI